MVSIGDNIKVGNKKGKVTHILEKSDDRYVIIYQSRGKTFALIEGDDDFKVIK